VAQSPTLRILRPIRHLLLAGSCGLRDHYCLSVKHRLHDGRVSQVRAVGGQEEAQASALFPRRVAFATDIKPKPSCITKVVRAGSWSRCIEINESVRLAIAKHGVARRQIIVTRDFNPGSAARGRVEQRQGRIMVASDERGSGLQYRIAVVAQLGRDMAGYVAQYFPSALIDAEITGRSVKANRFEMPQQRSDKTGARP